MRALLYYSRGSTDTRPLQRSLSSLVGSRNLQLITAAEIVGGALEDQGLETLFVIPGGQSRIYAEELASRGASAIREYTARGGKYLGICAGAFGACRRTLWIPGDGDDRTIDNELCMVDAEARGPIPGLIPDGQQFGICELAAENGAPLPMLTPTLYSHGPEILLSKNSPATVLARYLRTGTPAIVAQRYGLGKLLLIGPHMEWDAEHLREVSVVRSNPIYSSGELSQNVSAVLGTAAAAQLTQEPLLALLEQFIFAPDSLLGPAQ